MKTLFVGLLVFVASFIFVRPLIILIYVFVEYDRSAKDVQRIGTGYLTTECWACDSKAGLESICGELRAARYLLIPAVVLSALHLATLAWLLVRVRNEAGRRPKNGAGLPVT